MWQGFDGVASNVLARMPSGHSISSQEFLARKIACAIPPPA